MAMIEEQQEIRIVEKKVHLQGLTCANCAAKITAQVQDLDEVIEAEMNLVQQTMNIELVAKASDQIIDKITTIVHRLEPHVKVFAEKSETHSHDHHTHTGSDLKKEWIQLGIGSVFFVAALLFQGAFGIKFGLFFVSFLIIGGEVVYRAARNILRGQVFDENFLMTVATLGAFVLQEYPEAVAVMLFYQVGEMFQGMAVDRSRRSIQALLDIRPEYANLETDGKLVQVNPGEISIDQIIVVKPGERVPLDGVVVSGESMVDTSALTGESVPRAVKAGEEILSGFINLKGLLQVRVIRTFQESAVVKILDMVENASSRKAPTENFITKFARYYTPAVVISALAIALLPPLFIADASFYDWLYRGLIFLVVSCPCALVISIPLGFFGGIGGASRQGILIKGGNYLEAINEIETVVFDKTGTLTKGVFQVQQLKPVENVSTDELLRYAALAEAHSNHPIATSILDAFEQPIYLKTEADYEEISGHGVKVEMDGERVLAGNDKLMAQFGIEGLPAVLPMGTVVHVALDNRYLGHIVISDQIKEDAAKAVTELHNTGIQVAMLTGDREEIAKDVGRELNIDRVYANLLPDEKVEQIEKLAAEKRGGKILFVGDGINDAPVLARADVGVAMGGLGSDAAIEAADVVLMTDEPLKLVDAIGIARKTRHIVWQNIIFALGVKGLVLLLSTLGYATMWEAVFADVGVALIAVLNSLRAMQTKK